MGKMIKMGNELIRINPERSDRIEISTNDGRNWKPRYNGNMYGNFEDLSINGNEILAMTSKGLFRSKNGGRNWVKRS